MTWCLSYPPHSNACSWVAVDLWLQARGRYQSINDSSALVWAGISGCVCTFYHSHVSKRLSARITKESRQIFENNLLYYVSPPSMPIPFDAAAVTCTVWIPGCSAGLPVPGPEQAHTIARQVLPQIAHNIYIGQQEIGVYRSPLRGKRPVMQWNHRLFQICIKMA